MIRYSTLSISVSEDSDLAFAVEKGRRTDFCSGAVYDSENICMRNVYRVAHLHVSCFFRNADGDELIHYTHVKLTHIFKMCHLLFM